MSTSITRRIGKNRGKARIWIEGKALAAAGWSKGKRFEAAFEAGQITYTASDAGDRKVAGTESRPIIDTNTDKIREALGDATHARIEIDGDRLTIKRGQAPASKVAGAVAAIALGAATFAAPYVSQFKQGAMSILVACEESATVRDAMTEAGHDAMSCDILPTRNPHGWHRQGRVEEVLDRDWDMIVAFPPCTYFSASSSWALKDADYERYPEVGYHQRVKPETLTGAERRAAQAEALALVKAIWSAAPKVAIENPVGQLSSLWMKPAQIIQPHEHGHAESKATCLWTKGLGKIYPTQRLSIEEHGWQVADGKHAGTWRWQNQTASGQNRMTPGADRGKDRSVTYAGIAKAMAKHWA